MSSSIGERLRAAREARAWSIEEIAGRLKVPARYVAALESDDSASLPEPTFVRGYIKSYAKAVGLDGDVLLASAVPLEVKAPRPLIGPEGQVASSRRSAMPARAPSFRGTAPRRYPIIAGLVVLVAVAGWYFSPVPEGAQETAIVADAALPSATTTPIAVSGKPSVAAPVIAGSAVTLDVPLPGAASQTAEPEKALAVAAQASSAVAVPAVAAPVTAAQKPGEATKPLPVTVSAPVNEAVPVSVAQRKGLHARFNGTCWVEVKDADNVVIHTRIAMAGNEINVDGKAPLTVTLGDASAAELWYNGERVTADRFSSNGIARIIVGQTAR